MPRKNGAVVEAVTRAEDMREAMVTIGRIVADTEVTPKGKLQRITGVLALYEIKVQSAKPTARPVLAQNFPMLPEGRL